MTSSDQPEITAGDAEFDRLLRDARSGSREAVGELVERYRNYLCLIANEQLDSVLRVKAGASDLVQESMLAVQRDLADFRGSSHGEWLAWLRAIIQHELHRTNRAYRGTQKRRMGRELPLESLGRQSHLGQGIADRAETPGTRAAANEQSARLVDAIGRLPEDYRLILKWRNWERLSFEEIAERLNRSPQACRKIWSRAVERLRREFDGDKTLSE